jgi:hypothetical protein
MERLTVTTAGNLQPGDRFYKRRGLGKKVYEIISHEPPWSIIIERGLLFNNYSKKISQKTIVIFLNRKLTYDNTKL